MMTSTAASARSGCRRGRRRGAGCIGVRTNRQGNLHTILPAPTPTCVKTNLHRVVRAVLHTVRQRQRFLCGCTVRLLHAHVGAGAVRCGLLQRGGRSSPDFKLSMHQLNWTITEQVADGRVDTSSRSGTSQQQPFIVFNTVIPRRSTLPCGSDVCRGRTHAAATSASSQPRPGRTLRLALMLGPSLCSPRHQTPACSCSAFRCTKV